MSVVLVALATECALGEREWCEPSVRDRETSEAACQEPRKRRRARPRDRTDRRADGDVSPERQPGEPRAHPVYGCGRKLCPCPVQERVPQGQHSAAAIGTPSEKKRSASEGKRLCFLGR